MNLILINTPFSSGVKSCCSVERTTSNSSAKVWNSGLTSRMICLTLSTSEMIAVAEEVLSSSQAVPCLLKAYPEAGSLKSLFIQRYWVRLARLLLALLVKGFPLMGVRKQGTCVFNRQYLVSSVRGGWPTSKLLRGWRVRAL